MFSTISKPSPCSTYTQRKPFVSQAKANLSSSVPKGISAVPRSNEVLSLSKLKSAGAALLASTALVGFQWSAVASEMALISENPIQAIEKAAGNVAEGVEEAIDGPSANRASAPSGSMGKVTNLADKNLEGGAQFDSAASKLKGDSARQYEAGQEVDKAIQKESEFKAASQFKKNNPGSETGNSTVDRVKNQFIGN